MVAQSGAEEVRGGKERKKDRNKEEDSGRVSFRSWLHREYRLYSTLLSFTFSEDIIPRKSKMYIKGTGKRR